MDFIELPNQRAYSPHDIREEEALVRDMMPKLREHRGQVTILDRCPRPSNWADKGKSEAYRLLVNRSKRLISRSQALGFYDFNAWTRTLDGETFLYVGATFTDNRDGARR